MAPHASRWAARAGVGWCAPLLRLQRRCHVLGSMVVKSCMPLASMLPARRWKKCEATTRAHPTMRRTRTGWKLRSSSSSAEWHICGAL